MIAESVTIILPLPPAVLSPNRPCFSAGGRITRAVATKKQRRLAREQVEAEEIGETWGKVTAQACFYHKSKRRRDGCNFNSMLKGAFDGVVDAGLVADDDHEHWTTLPPAFDIDKKNPRVAITVTRVE